MTTITTSDLRENMAQIFESIQTGKDVVIRFGRGKKAKLARLSLLESTTATQGLPKNHSLLKFVESDFYKNLPAKAVFSNIKDLKKYYKQNFAKDKYAKYDL
jgi:antitoxin (DNA-binding transcriptional repressor) of toxin-antitoxin stability system